MNVRLFLWQRATALLLAPMVVVHLAVIACAVGGGLTAAEILSRTRGSFAWAAFYGLFVIAAAVHGSIGVNNVLREWTPARSVAAGAISIGTGIVLIVLGFRAVAAVVLT